MIFLAQCSYPGYFLESQEKMVELGDKVVRYIQKLLLIFVKNT